MSATLAPATVTVVVTTRNRKDDLKTCLDSIRRQTLPPQVIVVDDASTDGTPAMVAAEFPEVTLLGHLQMEGYIAGRNEAARRATSEVIVSLDDDAAFADAEVLRETLAAFTDPRIGAVAIPYIDVHRGPQVRQSAPDRHRVFLANTFIGTAHAVRREVFERVGGYREPLFHQGEESDFCIRMLAAGYVVRLGSGAPIHHFESPKRDFSRMDHYGPRNALLFVHQNVPMPAATWRLLATTAGLLTWTLSPRRLLRRIIGMAAGFSAMRRSPRAPVRPEVFAVWRRLQTADPPLTLDEIAGELPGARA